MMKRNILKRAGLIGASGLLCSADIAKADNWEIYLCNRFHSDSGDSLNDNFYAGVTDFSNDGYDLGDDILNPPPVPGEYSDLTTLVDGNRLMVDNKSPIPFLTSKNWPIDLIVGNPSFTIMSGDNLVIWDISQVPSFYSIHLNDYGSDSSRTALMNSIDMRSNLDYQFPVNGVGIVRYLDLEVQNVPEHSGILSGIGIIGYLSRRKRGQ